MRHVYSRLILLISEVNIVCAPCSSLAHLIGSETRIVTSLVADSLFICTVRGASLLAPRNFLMPFQVIACVRVVRFL